MAKYAQGQVVQIQTKRGPQHVVIAHMRFMRSGRYEYTCAPVPAPAKPCWYTPNTDRFFSPATATFTPAQIAAAVQAMEAAQGRKVEGQAKRTEANLTTIGEVDWVGGARGRWEAANIKPGDRVTIEGSHGTWRATVGAVRVSDGRVGLVREGRDIEAERDRAQTLEVRMRMFDELSGLGGRRRHLRGPVEFRWIDARHVVGVERDGAKVERS